MPYHLCGMTKDAIAFSYFGREIQDNNVNSAYLRLARKWLKISIDFKDEHEWIKLIYA